jgi:hypothetical protein
MSTDPHTVYTESRFLPVWTAVVIMCVGICSQPAIGQRQSKPYYHEDLYGLRPNFPEPFDSLAALNQQPDKQFVAANATVNEKVNDVLDSINSFNITRKFIEGFTIQIHSGQNREEAMNAKKKMTFTDLNAILEYTQPKFRVRVGNYYSRLEAHRDLTRLKRIYTNAILVPEKILVR